MSDKVRLKITNISGGVLPPNGKILDYHGSVIGNGKYAIVSCDGIDELLEEWSRQKWAKVQNPATGEILLGATPTTVTLGTRVTEISGEAIDEFGQEDELGFDPSDAQEAVLVGNVGAQSPKENTKPLQGDLNQQRQRVKISLGSESERGDSADLSPIPGEQLREVDSASNFTIRAKPAPSGPAGR